MKNNNKSLLEKMSELYDLQLNETINQDDFLEIKSCISETFDESGECRSPKLLHEFGNSIVRIGSKVADKKITNTLENFAQVERFEMGILAFVEVPQRFEKAVQLLANGDNVDVVRIGDSKRQLAIPMPFVTEFEYNSLDIAKGDESSIENLISVIADVKTNMYIEQASMLLNKEIDTVKNLASDVERIARLLVNKPLRIVEYGKTKQLTTVNTENQVNKVKIYQDASISMFCKQDKEE